VNPNCYAIITRIIFITIIINIIKVVNNDITNHSYGNISMINFVYSLQNGTLKIIDRKKHIFKLSQGEYIVPEKIENIYIRSQYVQQVFVCGESLKASCLDLLQLGQKNDRLVFC
jgi:hypothetical protein